jgi:protein-disulfide isomerase
VLGLEQEIMDNYVATGQVKVIFSPVLNHGSPSVFSTVAADCVAHQNPELFWAMHGRLFAEQAQLWTATRDYYVNTAVAIGADQAQFEQCYDDGSGLARVQALDELRRARGITSQPIFDVNGVITPGLGNLVATIDGVISELEQ